jgi:hypothetical protein
MGFVDKEVIRKTYIDVATPFPLPVFTDEGYTLYNNETISLLSRTNY